MISGAPGCLLWLVTAGGVLAEADTVARLEGLLAQALEANERLAALVERQREEIARLGEQLAAKTGAIACPFFTTGVKTSRPSRRPYSILPSSAVMVP